ncbi:Tungsten-containing aldehyde ferredoxin oxidoreductase (fragment) [uncultured Desulfobacterium sp.]|uniref:Tungsten-containing aldehyde ferredoxin oxidoreductase n=1 Tax=uncultured Desulfobacterium sp. TaxID=201089 RepID=A0A445MVA6_9BACT
MCDAAKKETDHPSERISVSCIGPAGENMVLMSSIINDKHRAAARCGIGAVMGSKNLKALAVSGSKRVEVADPEILRRLAKEVVKKIKSNPAIEGFTQFGTSGFVMLLNEMGILPTRNFQRTAFERAVDISGEVLNSKYLKKKKACFGCVIACGRGTQVSEPGYEGSGEGPEYESVALLGSNLGNGNMSSVTKANYLCNQFGLDTISVGGTIACAMEMFERGYLTKKDTGGIALKFGDEKLVVTLVEMIAKREGFGDKLADGGFRLAEEYGHPECFMGLHKMELPGYEPRGAKGMGISYMTSPIGPSHCRGYTIPFEILGTAGHLDPIQEEGKGMLTKSVQDMTAAWDATGLCLFTTLGIGMDEVLSMLMAVTGSGFAPMQFLKIGERIFNLQRLFNLKAGFKIEDEKLPDRFYHEPLPDGPNAGAVLNLEKAMAEYCQLRGWDENRKPYYGKLRGLGLTEYAL